MRHTPVRHKPTQQHAAPATSTDAFETFNALSNICITAHDRACYTSKSVVQPSHTGVPAAAHRPREDSRQHDIGFILDQYLMQSTFLFGVCEARRTHGRMSA